MSWLQTQTMAGSSSSIYPASILKPTSTVNCLDLSRESQRHVLSQVAEVLKIVQKLKLPATASGFGGLAFDEDGNIVRSQFVVEPYTGPYPDMKSFYTDMLRAQLKEADRSQVAKG